MKESKTGSSQERRSGGALAGSKHNQPQFRLTSRLTLSKALPCSRPQFPHLSFKEEGERLTSPVGPAGDHSVCDAGFWPLLRPR